MPKREGGGGAGGEIGRAPLGTEEYQAIQRTPGDTRHEFDRIRTESGPDEVDMEQEKAGRERVETSGLGVRNSDRGSSGALERSVAENESTDNSNDILAHSGISDTRKYQTDDGGAKALVQGPHGAVRDGCLVPKRGVADVRNSVPNGAWQGSDVVPGIDGCAMARCGQSSRPELSDARRHGMQQRDANGDDIFYVYKKHAGRNVGIGEADTAMAICRSSAVPREQDGGGPTIPTGCETSQCVDAPRLHVEGRSEGRGEAIDDGRSGSRPHSDATSAQERSNSKDVYGPCKQRGVEQDGRYARYSERGAAAGRVGAVTAMSDPYGHLPAILYRGYRDVRKYKDEGGEKEGSVPGEGDGGEGERRKGNTAAPHGTTDTFAHDDDGYNDTSASPPEQQRTHRLPLNALPDRTVNLDLLAEDTPCAITHLAIKLHTSDECAKRMLRPLQKGLTKGTVTAPTMRRHITYAVRRKNMKPSRVEHFHVAFTRVKGNGKELRMIVDGTDNKHPNAFNERLPEPPTPPGMMRVPTGIAMVMTSRSFSVDDISTAFPTMGMCRTMTRALGVKIEATASQPAIVVSQERVPQGGTWSAATCQGHTVTVVVPADSWPERQERLAWGERSYRGTPSADWMTVLLGLKLLVHIDDVITCGHDNEDVERRRRSMKERGSKYGIVWKEAEPAGQQGSALGVNYDLHAGTWGVKEEWMKSFTEELQGWDRRDLDHVKWGSGCMAWITQVLHLPGILQMAEGATWTEWARTVVKTRARYVEDMTWAERVSPWPRRQYTVQLSDACIRGWAGGTFGQRGIVAGRWYRCKNGALSTKPCCSDTTVTLESGEMIVAEGMATIETYLGGVRGSGDHLVLTDNEPWATIVAKSHSADQTLGAMAAFWWVIAEEQLASAHVEGTINVMDGPSRPDEGDWQESMRQAQADLDNDKVPLHRGLRWSTIGVVRRCPHNYEPIWAAARRVLPCSFVRIGDEARAGVPLSCGCSRLEETTTLGMGR